MKQSGKKYEFTVETIEVSGRTLHRIKAIRDFGYVKAGELGGFIEKEENLSHEGNCWVYNDAKVYGDAEVCGYANVHGNAWVYGNANVCVNANVCGYAKVHGNAWVYGNANVCGDAEVCGYAKVHGNAWVYGYANVCGNAEVYGDAKVCGDAKVHGNAWVYGNANVCGNAEVYGDAKVCDDAKVCGDAEVCGNAEISMRSDYIVFENWWSSGRFFTWTRSNNMWKVGCFYGTGEELIQKAYKDSEISGREYEKVVRYVESILADEKKR